MMPHPTSSTLFPYTTLFRSDQPHDARGRRIGGVELRRLEELPSRVRPTCGMHHLRPADAIVSAIAVGLQNALKLSQEFLGPVAPPPQAEVEHHATSRPAVLPQIRLVVLPSPIVHLHINCRFIGLDVTTAE